MDTALYVYSNLRDMLWNGLGSVTHPVLGVSFLTVFVALFLFNVFTAFFSVLTGGKQDQSTGGRLDNNNNYIYRR